MSNLNDFFRKMYSSPSLLWGGMAAVIFIVLGLAIMIMPSLTGFEPRTQFGLGGILIVYGLYRFWSFYSGIKDRDNG
jgi:hypothetical protein